MNELTISQIAKAVEEKTITFSGKDKECLSGFLLIDRLDENDNMGLSTLYFGDRKDLVAALVARMMKDKNFMEIIKVAYHSYKMYDSSSVSSVLRRMISDTSN